ncbi:MAG: alpha/beta hydrolase [Isosphaeraceae bacterium]|nr:alpha/beta hydrolase [Isosphaeraceae bacterium]
MPHHGRATHAINLFLALCPAIAIAIAGSSAADEGAVGLPEHPATAIAKNEARHGSITRTRYGVGARSYWIFEPDSPRPESAPVLVFTHGWLAMNPGIYGAWLDHLVRRGAIVIYPTFQEGWGDDPETFLPRSIEAVRDALDVLRTSNRHIKPDLRRFGLIGHSTGGVIAARIAAASTKAGLPPPRFVLAVTPGELVRTQGPTLERLSRDLLLVVVAAEHDLAVGDAQARELFAEAKSIPRDRKLYVLFRSDLRGRPGILADHLAPTAASPEFDTGDGPLHGFQMTAAAVDAFDRSGLWRVADMTGDAAFAGRSLDEATDSGRAFRNLGYWTDGRPVAPPLVANDLEEIPRFILPHGFRLVPWHAPTFGAGQRTAPPAPR